MSWQKVPYRSIKPRTRVLCLWNTQAGEMFAHGLLESRTTEPDEGPDTLWLQLTWSTQDQDYGISRNALPFPVYGFRPKGTEKFLGPEDLGTWFVNGMIQVHINLKRKRHAFYVPGPERLELPGHESLYEALMTTGWRSRDNLKAHYERYYRNGWQAGHLADGVAIRECMTLGDWSTVADLCFEIVSDLLDKRTERKEYESVASIAALKGQLEDSARLDFRRAAKLVSDVQSAAYRYTQDMRNEARTLPSREMFVPINEYPPYFDDHRKRILEVMKPARERFTEIQEQRFQEKVAEHISGEAWERELERRRFVVEGNPVGLWADNIGKSWAEIADTGWVIVHQQSQREALDLPPKRKKDPLR